MIPATKVLAELDRLTSNITPASAVEIATWLAMRLPILRAALTPPQEVEVEECTDRLEAMAEGYSAEAAKFFRNAARLLRATQSNDREGEMSQRPTGDASKVDSGSLPPAQSSAAKVGVPHCDFEWPRESPAQSAPAQEPVAWAWFHRGQVNFDGSDALRELDDLKATPIPLYAAPQPDEARELLREVVRRYDDYRGKGVMPTPGEYQMVVGAIERIRAYLEKHK